MSPFTNEAAWDRGVRVLLGVVLLGLGWSGTVVGAMGVFLKVFGILPLVTGLAGWCPLYTALGIRTGGGPGTA